MDRIVRLKFTLFLNLAVMSLLLTSCVKHGDEAVEAVFTVRLVNMSPEPVYAVFYEGWHLATPGDVLEHSDLRELETILPQQVFERDIVFRSTSTPRDGYYQILVFKEATIKNYSVSELINYVIYDERYLFNLIDLEECDYTLYYQGK